MRPDDDFAAYVAARWPQLVRQLALLGCPDELLEDVAADGLARCRRGWAATVRRGDADEVVPAAVQTAWAERRRTDWWVGVPPPSYSSEREAADAVLDRLPEAERAAVAMGEPSVLDDRQQAVVERASAAVPVLAPPIDDVLRRRVRRRPGRRRRVALATAAAIVLAGGVVGAVRSTGDDDPPASALDPVAAVAEENPVAVAWYADDELHLPGATLRTGRVADLVEVADGAVYLDPDGRVVRVDEDGARTLLGQSDPETALAGSAGGRLVAWREGASGDLVVRDVARDREVARVPGTGLRPVAVDDGRLYYNAEDGAYAVLLPDGEPHRLGPLPLLDVRAGNQLLVADYGQVRLRSPALGSEVTATGAGGRLSDDGRLALVRQRGGPVVLDALGGRPALGSAPGEVVVAARLVEGGRVVLAVVPADQPEPDDATVGRLSEAGSWELRTCVIGLGECDDGVRIGASGPVPLFAH